MNVQQNDITISLDPNCPAGANIKVLFEEDGHKAVVISLSGEHLWLAKDNEANTCVIIGTTSRTICGVKESYSDDYTIVGSLTKVLETWYDRRRAN